MTYYLVAYISITFFGFLFFWFRYKYLRIQAPPVQPEELKAFLDRKPRVIDVRTYREWELKHLSGSEHIDLKDITEIDHAVDQPILIVCNSGIRSSKAAEDIKKKGLKEVYYYQGNLMDLEAHV